MNYIQEEIIEHYQNPRNYGEPSWTPTHSALSQNLSCGDEIRIYLQISKGAIKRISFTGSGCSISIASASIFTTLIKNLSLNDAKNFTLDDLFINLGFTPTPARQRCAELVLNAFDNSLKK